MANKSSFEEEEEEILLTPMASESVPKRDTFLRLDLKFKSFWAALQARLCIAPASRERRLQTLVFNLILAHWRGVATWVFWDRHTAQIRQKLNLFGKHEDLLLDLSPNFLKEAISFDW